GLQEGPAMFFQGFQGIALWSLYPLERLSRPDACDLAVSPQLLKPLDHPPIGHRVALSMVPGIIEVSGV
ncbi:hypothetical protein P9432_27150, partial [Escherichia coli]|uniref:hypothetical protein n=1 Tax=Escherichia coli TaxID=562 RepID=UPI00389291D4